MSNNVVLVTMEGPDPRELKTKNREFFVTNGTGRTKFSASGIAFLVTTMENHTICYVVTAMHVLSPFVKNRSASDDLGVGGLRGSRSTNFLAGTEMTVFFDERNMKMSSLSTADDANGSNGGEGMRGYSAKYVGGLGSDDAERWIRQLTQGASEWTWGWQSSHLQGLSSGVDATAFALLRIDNVEHLLQHYPHSAKLHGAKMDHNMSIAKGTLLKRRRDRLRQGESVSVVSSPFGLLSPATFLNSVTRGIVSNVVGATCDHVLITDARMLPGTEGGAIFDENNNLIALCTLPLRRTDGDVELNVGICVDAIEETLSNMVESDVRAFLSEIRADNDNNNDCKSRIVIPEAAFGKATPLRSVSSMTKQEWQSIDSNHVELLPSIVPLMVQNASRSVVLIHVGNSWASGVLVSHSGHILTNAHLVKPFLKDPTSSQLQLQEQIQILVQFNEDLHQKARQFYRADLEFMVTKGPLDLALLKLHSPAQDNMSRYYMSFFDRTDTYTQAVGERKPAVLDKRITINCGDTVYAIGFPLFYPYSGIRASVTRGTVSNIVTDGKGCPVLVQTSALIHNGNSGGIIVDEQGRFIALVTSNARQSNKHKLSNGEQGGNSAQRDSRLIPSLNFAIPCAQLHPVAVYLSSEGYDLSILEQQFNNPEIDVLSQIWSFQPLKSSTVITAAEPPQQQSQYQLAQRARFGSRNPKKQQKKSNFLKLLEHINSRDSPPNSHAPYRPSDSGSNDKKDDIFFHSKL